MKVTKKVGFSDEKMHNDDLIKETLNETPKVILSLDICDFKKKIKI